MLYYDEHFAYQKMLRDEAQRKQPQKIVKEEYDASGTTPDSGAMGSAEYMQDFHDNPKLAAYNVYTRPKKQKKNNKSDNPNPPISIPNGPSIDMLDIAVKDLTTSLVEKVKTSKDQDIHIDPSPYKEIAKKELFD